MKYGISTTSEDAVIDSIVKDELTGGGGGRGNSGSNGSPRVATKVVPDSAAEAATSTTVEAPTAATTMMEGPARPGVKHDVEAVVFSIQFYGKTVGEVGLMNQDLAQLDWKKFKSYLFQNLLSMNHQENICVSYNDDEGDKLPIESDEEYQEALKIAKKKAEAHDKMVLDITRQGGLPTVLSFVSSGIKRVSSSPPKEGGISFFKASSPPKESSGFMAKAVGTERKLFTGIFSPDRGPIPGHVKGVWGYNCDEALDNDKPFTTATEPTAIPTACAHFESGPPLQDLQNSSPKLLYKYKSDASSHSVKTKPLNIPTSQDVFGAGSGQLPDGGARPRVTQKQRHDTEHPPQWFTSYMSKFRTEFSEEVSQQVVAKVTEALLDVRSTSPTVAQGNSMDLLTNKMSFCHLDITGKQMTPHPGCFPKDSLENQGPRVVDTVKTNLDSSCCDHKSKVKDKMEDLHSILQDSNSEARVKKSKEKVEGADTGAKRKKFAREEEKLFRKQEKVDERLTKLQEKLVERLHKKQEKVEEKILKKQEKLTEKILKQQEKVEKKKLVSKYADEMDKASRTQEKVLAKMEGLRKKQACSPEEFNKLRKMVNKHHRVIAAEHRQQRRNDRKTGNWKAGKSKKLSIDNMGFPVDASLLHAALQELEALAEDSPTEGSGGGTTRGYDALYLKDITYPDGSEVLPGKEFVKTWRVVNSGVMPWNDKTILCKWTQVRFRGSPAGWKLKPSLKKVVCPPLQPGQEGDISITFTAPSEPGWYATHWRFCQRGRVFGNQMWCAVHVTEDPNFRLNPHWCKSLENSDDEQRPEQMPVLSDTLKDDSVLRGAPTQRSYTQISSGLTCEPRGHPREDLCVHPDFSSQVDLEVGIVENYYDAEDPAQKELSTSLQCMTLSCPDVVSDAVDTKRIEQDLISFEEDAEVVSSGASTPEIIHSIPQPHAVVPLKEMAKESVESLRESSVGKDQQAGKKLQNGHNAILSTLQADALSISSGSFSELDSEDQAILNESDTELSDHEYYVVNLPECFNMNSSHMDLVGAELLESSETAPDIYNEAELPNSAYHEADRPESPGFLTADEDDRTTTAVSELPDDQTERIPVTLSSSNASREDSDARTVEVFPAEKSTTQDCIRSQNDDSHKTEINKTSNPHPPPETKPFMEIPAEALRTNLAYTVHKQIRTSVGGSDPDAHSQEQNQATWVTGSDDVQGVVCEQPSSAQHKEPGRTSRIRSGAALSDDKEAATKQIPELRELPVDLVGALPDELVSIIPEDLVRGVWNTARTLITRINQEMLSPSADSPGRVYRTDDNPANESQCPQPEVTPEPVATVQESTPSQPEVNQCSRPPLTNIPDNLMLNEHNRPQSSNTPTT
ncbi:hypothetical protein OTU49_004062 [Cherax quadricarinatus]|uniref:Next to BRCA1 central domain-containing protein n=1 Tax=Cherax quadricarinatus TaxID=27406 RepID=A0AAW0XEE9_CHEQU